MAIDERFKRGLELFNREEFFESHEVIEGLWRETKDEFRDFYQGVIQAAAAMHHLKRGTLPGGISVFESAVERLKRYPSVTMGLNVRKLIDDMKMCFDLAQQTNSNQVNFPQAEFNFDSEEV